MIEIFTQVGVLFGLVFLGFCINKFGIFDEVSDKKISALLVNVTLPATVLAAAFGEQTGDKMSAVIMLAIAAVIFTILPLFAKLFSLITKSEKTYKLMVTYPNLGFMGIPIMATLYGNQAVFYTSMFMIIFNISVFSYGISVVKGGNGFDIKKLISPGIISAIAALIFFLFDIPCPTVIYKLLNSVGSITSPLAMMLIGSTLAAVNFKEMLKTKLLYVLTIYKMVLIPFIVWFVLHFFITDPIMLGTSVILMSLPVAGNVSMISIAYGGNKDLAAKGICITTICSLITAPIYMMLFAL